jgi:CRISPR system Cascade subunit CasA
VSEFNLIDEPWIPVRFLDGHRAELGIRETLLRSKVIAEIEDQSPLVVAALHRCLLAVLYRALEGPTDIAKAKVLFREGIPRDKVGNYLAQWHHRFWLLDDTFPFWQIPGFAPKEWRAWTVLAAEHNADNAKVLFDHLNVESAGTISSAEAARWLLAVQTFAVSSGKSEIAHTAGAPSATAIMALPLGGTLEDTLIFGLVPQNRELIPDDLAVWEREAESLERLKSAPKRAAVGIADLYTWRSRTVLLLEQEQARIAKLGFASGVAYLAGVLNDPMVAYREDEKLGKVAMQLRERGLWRDFDSLLPDGANLLSPAVVAHASALTQRDLRRRPRAILAIGQAANKAKIEFWRGERFVLPEVVVVANDGTARARLRELLNDAETAQHALWKGCQSFARDVIGRGERTPVPKDVSAFIRQMTVTPAYWAILETRFHDLLKGYTMEREPEDIRAEWLSAIREALERAWLAHASAVQFSDAWTIRALVKAERFVAKELIRLDSEISQRTRENAA